MTREEIDRRFESAKRVALECGDFLLHHAELREEESAKGQSDYVTSADLKVEEIITSMIKRDYSEDSIFAEESGKSGESPNRWIIDPIDGTSDFMSLFPFFSISIAFEDGDGLLFGVVYIPSLKEEFYAMRGEGAYLNGRRIHVHESSTLEKDLMIAVPPERHHEYMSFYLDKLRSFYDVFADIRSIGSAASSLCMVASGRVDAYYEISLKLYDVAAGIVIVREAGGIVDLFMDDEMWIELLASSKSSNPVLVDIIGGPSHTL